MTVFSRSSSTFTVTETSLTWPSRRRGVGSAPRATGTTISETTTSQTFTAVPGTCPVPAVAVTADITVPQSISASRHMPQDCFNKIPGDTCLVSCAAGYIGAPAQYTCELSPLVRRTCTCDGT